MTLTAARTSSPTTPAPAPSRRLRARAGLAALLALSVFALAACMNDDQQAAFDKVQNARSAAGIHTLHHDNTAQAKAQAWAEHLASRNTLAHSNLASGMDDQYRRIAENVGYAGSIDQVQQSFMNSGGHRANILDRGFTHLGVGVAHAHGKTWVVQVFTQR